MFYNNLKSVCEKKGIAISSVVKECGGAVGSINGWKKGAYPNSEIVIKLSMRLNVSIDYLLTGEEKKYDEHINEIKGNETEFLRLFKLLSNDEQMKILGRMELLVEQE